LKEALYYEGCGEDIVCKLCPHACIIKEGKRGVCQTRHNTNRRLYALNYAQLTSYGLDRMEKKPLYHFYPGSSILSIGTWGCNFSCRFCQNHGISKDNPQAAHLPPEAALKLAIDTCSQKNVGIAYTYSEPLVWFEYILDTVRLVHQSGLKNVLVTNGFINKEPLIELLPYIDAMNIDVKAFNNDFYRDICSGSLREVMQTVEEAARTCHVEITTLLVPGLNDNLHEIDNLASWIKSIDENIPLHFSRYFPKYKMHLEPTPLETLEEAAKIAGKYLNYVYVGNVSGNRVNTYCPSCNLLLIDRLNFKSVLTDANKCPQCGFDIKITGTTAI